jgi:hypothetical protein
MLTGTLARLVILRSENDYERSLELTREVPTGMLDG